MNGVFQKDYFRMTGKKWSFWGGRISLLLNYELRYVLFIRKRAAVKNRWIKKLYHLRQMRWNARYGLDIQMDRIGDGLYLGHAHNINVNPRAVIGKNCNLAKGVTIGQENRGKRMGAPILGDRVWVGTNAVIVGRIVIGEDVLIAPNSYVNCDVPAHSVVIGNPCTVLQREDATSGYISRATE